MTQEERVRQATNDLRKRKFDNNLSFLILSDKLPGNQSYLEFRDGHIEIQKLYTTGKTYHFKTVRTISKADSIRKEYGFVEYDPMQK